MQRVLSVALLTALAVSFCGCQCCEEFARFEAYKNQSLFGCPSPYRQAYPAAAIDPCAGQCTDPCAGLATDPCASGSACGDGCNTPGGCSTVPLGAQPGYLTQPYSTQPYPFSPNTATPVPAMPGPETYAPVH